MGDNQRKKPMESTQELLLQLDALLNEEWEAGAPEPAALPEQDAALSEQREAQRKRTARWSEWMTLIHDLVYILAAVALIFTFLIRVARVEGGSMNPTLVNHDRMLLLSSVWYSDPEPGDIVVARVLAFSEDPIVKRVIAVEGDTVDIDFERGIVYVNGVALEEPYILEPTTRDFGSNGVEFPLTVEDNHVFLMGDNRNHSDDSRYAVIGQVDTRCILGKAFFVILPGQDANLGERDYSRIGFME